MTNTGPPPPPHRPEAADECGPDGWEANHVALAQLAEHRVIHRP